MKKFALLLALLMLVMAFSNSQLARQKQAGSSSCGGSVLACGYETQRTLRPNRNLWIGRKTLQQQGSGSQPAIATAVPCFTVSKLTETSLGVRGTIEGALCTELLWHRPSSVLISVTLSADPKRWTRVTGYFLNYW